MIALASPADPRVLALMNAQQAELTAIYKGSWTEPFNPAVLTGEGCVLLVDDEGGELVACAALKRWDDGRSAEVKRMYTAPAWRGQGRGKALLAALVERGRALGYDRLVLETGALQPAAILIYERAGFTRIPNFGHYEGIEDSWCYALKLT
jgi:putative acetyltransferase